jgi:hypothetical protein
MASRAALARAIRVSTHTLEARMFAGLPAEQAKRPPMSRSQAGKISAALRADRGRVARERLAGRVLIVVRDVGQQALEIDWDAAKRAMHPEVG